MVSEEATRPWGKGASPAELPPCTRRDEMAGRTSRPSLLRLSPLSQTARNESRGTRIRVYLTSVSPVATRSSLLDAPSLLRVHDVAVSESLRWNRSHCCHCSSHSLRLIRVPWMGRHRG